MKHDVVHQEALVTLGYNGGTPSGFTRRCQTCSVFFRLGDANHMASPETKDNT